MATVLGTSKSLLSLHCHKLIARTAPSIYKRAVSTLPNSPHVYVHEQLSASPRSYILSLLPNEPPTPSLALGTSTSNPPTPETLTENPDFLKLVHWTIKDFAPQDPNVQAQAAMYASQAGSALGSGGVFFPSQGKPQRRRTRKGEQAPSKPYGGGGGVGGDGAGGASAQGGMGGAGNHGWIHVSDERNPPDFGRVAWPEDIFGSLEVDGEGKFVDGTGRYQEAGTYRMCTREGVMHLSPFLREKLVARLKELDAQARKHG